MAWAFLASSRSRAQPPGRWFGAWQDVGGRRDRREAPSAARQTYFCSPRATSLRWVGQCAGCGEWNTWSRRRGRTAKLAGHAVGRAKRAARRGRSRCATSPPAVEQAETGSRSSTACSAAASCPVLSCCWAAPGIGKSTLTGMALGNLVAAGHRALYVSGEESAAQVRMRASATGRCGAQRAGGRGDVARGRARDARVRATGRLRHRLHPDPERRGDDRRAGFGRSGARGRERDPRGGQADRLRGRARGPRDQGGRGRRAARARAPRRLRPAVRGRTRAQLPDPAGAEEPLRGDQRGRRVRDEGRGGSSRSRIRRRGSSARLRAHPAPASCARWRAPGRSWSRSRRSSRRPRSCRRAA